MIKAALIGNPNSGKTTLFNILTGSTAHVGNWPGVTVDKKEGVYKKIKEDITIVDLPGIYSLSPYTPEEVVSRNFLIDDKPEIVINIIDATSLERGLYLTTQVMEIDVPIIIALNMMDIVRKTGNSINVDKLSEELGIPIVEISALKGVGIDDLMKKALEVSKTKRIGKSLIESSELNELYEKIYLKIKGTNVPSPVFHTVKLIEGDELEKASHPKIDVFAENVKSKNPISDYDGDFLSKVADIRYTNITDIVAKSSKLKDMEIKINRSDKIDKVLTNRWAGIPIFLTIMLLVFHFTFSENLFYLSVFINDDWVSFKNTVFEGVLGSGAINSPGVIFFNLFDLLIGYVGDLLASLFATSPEWVSSLIVDGVWSAVGSILSFIPQILCLFFFITILEDSGYMARVAFLIDKVFRKFGLSGKAFMPLLMCFGCAVPGIMATKTLIDEKERRTTIMITPFFSCGAKLPIWLAVAGVLLAGAYADLIVYSIYLLGIVVAIVTAIILKNTIKGSESPFIMEMPAYHLPRAKSIVILLWEKLKHYLAKAATIIAGSAVVIWFLSSFGFEDGAFKMVAIDVSLLSYIGKAVQILFIPLGFGQGEYGWTYVVSTLTGLIAKEEVPATLSLLSSVAGDNLISLLSIPAAYSFMAFNLLAVPCMAAVATARGELANKRHFWLSILFWMGTAYIVSLIIYWVGVAYGFNVLLGLGISFVVVIAIGLVLRYFVRRNRLSLKNN